MPTGRVLLLCAHSRRRQRRLRLLLAVVSVAEVVVAVAVVAVVAAAAGRRLWQWWLEMEATRGVGLAFFGAKNKRSAGLGGWMCSVEMFGR